MAANREEEEVERDPLNNMAISESQEATRIDHPTSTTPKGLTSEDSKGYDTNNNSGDRQESTIINNRSQKRPNKEVDFNSTPLDSHNQVPDLKGNDGSRQYNTSESDDWHLLEVDDQYSSDESIIGGRIIKKSKMTASQAANHYGDNKLVSVNNNNNDVTVKSIKINEEKKYVDIDPLLNSNEVQSKRLIYICTVLYALIPLASTFALIALVSIAFSRCWPITVAYVLYVIYDRNTCNRGGRRIEFVYKSKFWSYLAAYFPIKLRCSTSFKLNPNENYLLNYHPHGISAFGCVAAFGTNGLNFRDLFPGIVSRFMVHESCYSIPIMREIFSARGDCSVNSKSIDYILSKGWREGKTGNLLALVGGGLAEASVSDPKLLKIVVKTRKGFVKKAIIHGANLIPCIAFGENSVFHRVDFKPSSFMHQLETKFYQLFKFKHPIYYGASIFGAKSKGAMPYRRPITVVMGDPIRVARIENPSQEDVDNVHSLYLRELKSLYEANSDLCGVYDQVLELV